MMYSKDNLTEEELKEMRDYNDDPRNASSEEIHR